MSKLQKHHNELRSRLAEVPNVTDAIIDRTMKLAADLGELTSGDIEQLHDLCEQDARSVEVRDWLVQAKAEGDVQMWVRLNVQLDKLTTSRRLLMKDLKMTRSSIDEVIGKKDLKAKGKSGTDWDGIL